MSRSKATIDDCIGAMLDRHMGVSYEDVLSRYQLSDRMFISAVTQRIPEHLGEINELHLQRDSQLLKINEILSNESAKRELFNMGEQCVKEQYDRIHGKIPGESQNGFYYGTYMHPDNVKWLTYHVLTSANPQLGNPKRATLVQGLMSLPINLQDYMKSIGLGSALADHYKLGINNSPLELLKLFDKAYQEKTGERSLFDLEETSHLHEWSVAGHAPNSYWKVKWNLETAIYHTLTEDKPELASGNRDAIITTMQKLPANVKEYLENLGLKGLMISGFSKHKRNSPLAVMEVFDSVYQRLTGDASLFDVTQKTHLHKWGKPFRAPRNFWESRHLGEVVYHKLTEHNNSLLSKDRGNVVLAIKSLPSDLQGYFKTLNLWGRSENSGVPRKNCSPLVIVETFDSVYQAKTGNASLFDLSMREHLHRWSPNFKASKTFWQDPKNVEQAIYHTLTEHQPKLASISRDIVIEGVKSFPKKMNKYFKSIGLGGLMEAKSSINGSSHKILEVFDNVYQRTTGDHSLFDLGEANHLHKWGGFFRAPRGYWVNFATVEEAIYHTLTEENPGLAANDRATVLEGINKLPANLDVYFCSLGFGSLMRQGFPKGNRLGPRQILEIFDSAFVKRTASAGLFDNTQSEYLISESYKHLVSC